MVAWIKSPCDSFLVVGTFVAICAVFNVTTDYLLKPSEIDELSVKTEILERHQQELLKKDENRSNINRCILYTIGIYLLFLAVYFIGHSYFEVWNTSVILAEFLIATAIVILTWVKSKAESKD